MGLSFFGIAGDFDGGKPEFVNSSGHVLHVTCPTISLRVSSRP